MFLQKANVLVEKIFKEDQDYTNLTPLAKQLRQNKPLLSQERPFLFLSHPTKNFSLRELYILLVEQYILLATYDKQPGYEMINEQRKVEIVNYQEVIAQREAKGEQFVSPFSNQAETYFKKHAYDIHNSQSLQCHAPFLMNQAIYVDTKLKQETQKKLETLECIPEGKALAQTVGNLLSQQFRFLYPEHAFISKMNVLEALNRLFPR